MNDDNVIDTYEDKYRLLMMLEEYPEEPWFDGQSPLLRIEIRRPRQAQHVMTGSRPADDDSAIESSIAHWNTTPSDGNWAKFEKYLRAYFGTTKIVTYQSGDFWYATYDTKRWREWAGWTDEMPMPASAVNMDEYRAWIEGDVYGYRIERRVHVSEERHVQGPDGLARDETSEYDAWEPVEDDGECWGLYGSKYAREEAEAAWHAFLAGKGRERCATIGHGDRTATHRIHYYTDRRGEPVHTAEYTCEECTEAYSHRPSLKGFESTQVYAPPAAVNVPE